MFPNTVNTIESQACTFNNALKNITVGSGVTAVKDSAFAVNSSLSAVLFLGNKPTFGPTIFSSCPLVITLSACNAATGWGATELGVPVVKIAC
jgi:hypothetical protein